MQTMSPLTQRVETGLMVAGLCLLVAPVLLSAALSVLILEKMYPLAR